MSKKFEKLFEPIKINKMELKNRIALAPMAVGYSREDGTLTQRTINYYVRRAEGGTGLIISGITPVDKRGKPIAFIGGIWDNSHIPSWRKLADTIHAAGSKLSIQLMFGGIEGFPIMSKCQQISPSGGIWKFVEELFPMHPDLTKSMFMTRPATKEELREIAQKFADAAVRAKEAGADAVELNGAQGFLLQQMMSPYFNRRTDEYGGSLENRMRFPLEVVEKVRDAVGKDFPIIFRMVCTEGIEGGITLEEAKKMAKMFEEAGVDALHVTAGRGISLEALNLMIPIAEVGPTPIIDQVAEIKKVVKIPVIGVQAIRKPEEAERILEEGKADIVALGRALIADPDWVKKAEEGRPEDIRQCIGCNACLTNLFTSFYVQCLQNPEAGREGRYELKKVKVPRHVLVIGGGVAGLEVALVAAQRGHKVTLLEKSGTLGGQWNLAATPPGKSQFKEVVEWRVRQLKKMNNVKIELNKEVNPENVKEIVKELKPDIVVVATGSVPVIPRIPGVDKDNVVTAHDVLAGKAKVGQNVVIIGGGGTGVETASYLAEQGKKVTVVEQFDVIGKGLELGRLTFLLGKFAEKGVKIVTRAPVIKITEDNELIIREGGEIKSLGKFDTFVISVGVRSNNTITKYIEDLVPAVYEVGDAYPPATNGFGAIQQAALIGRML